MLNKICVTKIFLIGEYIDHRTNKTCHWNLYCDSSAWERYLTIYAGFRSTQYKKSATMTANFVGKEPETGEDFSISSTLIYIKDSSSLGLPQAFSALVPRGTNSIHIGCWGEGFNGEIYEIWSSAEDLTGNIYSNDNLPTEYE